MSQPSISVKDASGQSVTIYSRNPNGRASSADSQPVTVASDQPAIPISFPPFVHDAFGRVRVGEPHLLIDLKRVGSVPDIFASNAVTGTGSAVYAENRASTLLTVGANAGSATRRSKNRALYQPGKSMLVFQTFVMGAGQANVEQRVGLFDEKNGIYLLKNNEALSVVRRSFVSGVAVDVEVSQSEWNIDKFDGTGVSGITLDTSKAQILLMDLEWLGVGRVRIGFVVDGVYWYCHEFLNTNTTLSSVYMSNPNLPLTWNIQALDTIADTVTLEAICASVSSEGGYETTGITGSTDGGVAGKSIATDTNVEILAVRVQSAYADVATALAESLDLINTTTAAFRWRLVLNPTETNAGTWNAVTGSVMERNTTRVVTENTGIVVASGWGSASTNQADLAQQTISALGKTLDGTRDTLSLQVRHLTNQAETFYGSLSWREIY